MIKNQGLVILPPNLEKPVGALIFLAGPIKGSEKWQEEAISYLQKLAPEINIASPRKRLDREVIFTEEDYISQIDWETVYLQRAAEKGAIIFWFAKEAIHYCDRPFARTTSIEFGEWMAHHEHLGSKIVVGFEKGYKGDRYIRQRLKSCPDIPIRETLQETLDEAIALIAEINPKFL